MATLKSNWREGDGSVVGGSAVQRSLCLLSCICRELWNQQLLPSPRVRIFRSVAPGWFLSFFEPRRNASRWYRAPRQMRNDRSGGHNQSLVEFGTCKVLGLRFGLKRLGRPRATASNGCASPRDFEGHIPSMLLHPMIPMELPLSITFSGSVMRLARRRTRDVDRLRFRSPCDS
jgi:hypothetical protein